MVDAIQGRLHANIAYSRPVMTACPGRCFGIRLRSRVGLIALILAMVAACDTDELAASRNAATPEEAIDDVWHKAALRGVAFRAIGQEPGWLLEITNGESIMISTDYGNKVQDYAYVEPIVFQNERRTRYVTGEAGVIVEILGEPCTDVMSGESFEVSVSIIEPDRRLEGCGRALF